MKRINGEANVVAVNAAKEYGESSHFTCVRPSLFMSDYILDIEFHAYPSIMQDVTF